MRFCSAFGSEEVPGQLLRTPPIGVGPQQALWQIGSGFLDPSPDTSVSSPLIWAKDPDSIALAEEEICAGCRQKAAWPALRGKASGPWPFHKALPREHRCPCAHPLSVRAIA